MFHVVDAAGRVVNRSRNLAGIRRYASRVGIDRLKITTLPEDKGRLEIEFHDGARWRNAYGAVLVVDRKRRGTVRFRHPALACAVGR